MLYLDEPIRIGRLNLFKDYNNKALFYYLPGSPSVATEGGQPLFHLLIWRGEDAAGAARGGGFLTMTADLRVSQGEIENAGRELSRRFGVSASLVPLQVESGAVKVAMLDAASNQEDPGKFVEKILAHGTPSLYGDERAVFKAELSQDGAVAMQASLLNEGASPVMLIYELTYRGLMPAYECKIVIEFKQSYEYLKNRTTFSSLWFKSDVDREMEELHKKGSIKIEEVVYHTDDPQARQQRMQQLQDLARELAQWTFFKPGLNPGEVLAKNVRDLQAVGGLDAGAVGTGAGTPFHQAMTGATPPGTLPSRPAVATADVTTGGTRVSGNPVPAADAKPAEPRPAEPATPTTPTTPATPAGDQGPNAVDSWNRAGRPQGTYQLKEISQSESQEIVFELKQVSSQTRTIAPQGQLRILPGMATGSSRIQQISLDDQFFKRIEGAFSTQSNLAELGVHSMDVELRYGTTEGQTGPAHDESFVITADGQNLPFGFFRDFKNTLELQYKVTVNYKPDTAIGNDASKLETAWVKTTDRFIAIDPRAAGGIVEIDVQAASVDWALVKQIQAKVIYDDAAGDMDGETTVILKPQAESQKILVRPRKSDDLIRVSAEFHYASGEVDVVETSRRESGPIILNQPLDKTQTVDVTLLDPLSRYERVNVQFAEGDPAAGGSTRAFDLKGNNARASWSFRPDHVDQRDYRYRTTYFLNGPVREEPWVETGATQLLLGDRMDGILKVQVMLLGDLAAAQMKAVRIKLSYPDAPDWADPDFEKIIVARAPAEPFTWDVAMQDKRKTSYQVELEWFRETGEKVNVGPITVKAETLLLDPTRPEAVS